MLYRLCSRVYFALILLLATVSCRADDAATAERATLERDLQQLTGQLSALRKTDVPTERWADADAFRKGAAWALQYDTQLAPPDLALIRKALTRGSARLTALQGGGAPWHSRTGRQVRGYISAVDGSTQPYGLVVPDDYDPQRPTRLDVVLHGSMRPAGIAELKFIDRLDAGDDARPPVTGVNYIELHPLGRVENCYRWAGETDVFEALEAVCRNYHIDRDRIVLRGMSMGASGAWHLGLKHPDRFVALGPYCGYVDTHRFSETPLNTFVAVGPLPPHQEAGLHMLDSVDYAANAGIVPAIACMGEKDVFFQAHVLMAEAMRKEGLQMVNLISPGTGHTVDPVTHAMQMRLIGAFADNGLNHAPRSLRFVTWTLKYHRSHWLELLGLEQHYVRAEVVAQSGADGSVDLQTPVNVTRLAIHPPMLTQPESRLRIGGQEVVLTTRAANEPVVVVRDGAGWKTVAAADPVVHTGKRPGLQGPIDDAFCKKFLCVRGTGKPWNPAAQAYAEASLKRFAYEWQRYFRGDFPVKVDTEVTAEDIATSNLILFGDPGSNRLLAQALPQLPLRWTETELEIAGEKYASAEHAPLLIQPNPLPGGEGHYLVVNSGHTFHETELNKLNYLLFPRLGDWAVVKFGLTQPENPSDPLQETVLRAGYCDEAWKIAPTPGIR